jgi:hypothetical protein
MMARATTAPCVPRVCSPAYHEQLAEDAATWKRETAFIGYQVDEEAQLELANCRRCGSTLSRDVPVSRLLASLCASAGLGDERLQAVARAYLDGRRARERQRPTVLSCDDVLVVDAWQRGWDDADKRIADFEARRRTP